jgi:hypothetical protein
MRDVLSYYSKRFGQKATKERLLKLLVKLEGEVSDAEHAAIHKWLSVGSTTTPNLRKLLNTTRGIATELDDGVKLSPPPPPPPQIDCSVCMESQDAKNFPSQKITVLCNHEPTVCRTCLTQSIDSQIPEVAWDQVKCPECPETLPYDVVKDWASPEAFERYPFPNLILEVVRS